MPSRVIIIAAVAVLLVVLAVTVCGVFFYTSSDDGETASYVDTGPAMPKSCNDIWKMGNSTGSHDDYVIYPVSKNQPVKVACQMEKDGGWTVIQRRGFKSPRTDFHDKNWNDYKVGFGPNNGDYWLGLDNIHAITKEQDNELWASSIEVVHRTINGEHAGSFEAENGVRFKRFWVEDEANLYRGHFKDGVKTGGPDYNYMKDLDGKPFSTRDKDNTPQANSKEIECDTFKRKDVGGWWFQQSMCESQTNLNWSPMRPWTGYRELKIFFPGDSNRKPDKIVMRVKPQNE